MDSITQAAFGAVVGQAAFQNKLGRRAIIFGAIGGTIPDLDVLWQVGDVFTRWEVHRGFTHSVFFAPLMAPVMGYAIHRWYRFQAGRLDDPKMKALAHRDMIWTWIALFALTFFTHPFLDLMTAYGTQLLAPFSNYRFQVNALPIIDFLYTIPILLVVGYGLFCRTGPARVRASWAAFIVIGYTVAYQLYATAEMARTEQLAAAQLREEGFVAEQVDAYPTIFQPFFRRVVARTGDHYRVGFYSSLAPKPIQWTDRHSDETPAVEKLQATRGGRIFTWFASGNVLWYEVETPEGRMVVVDDMRYGGFDPRAPSFWSVGAVINPDGTLGEVQRLNNRRLSDDSFWDSLIAGIFGEETANR